jgi:hypothetical protein
MERLIEIYFPRDSSIQWYGWAYMRRTWAYMRGVRACVYACVGHGSAGKGLMLNMRSYAELDV